MSCQIDVLSVISDGDGVRKFLFPNWKDDPPAPKAADLQSTESSWNDPNWSWKDNEKAEDEESGKDNLSWFQQCIIGISPVGDCLVLASGNAAVFLSLKWDHSEEGKVKDKFLVNASEVLTEDADDEITALLCIPLGSLKRSSHGRPDWTAIIVGFRSGYVKMYTEGGGLLASQLFHREAVMSIKCRTFQRYSALAEQNEELTVAYEAVVVIIDGLSLYQMLRACRNQAAKALATSSGSGVTDVPPMAYKKWKFQDQELVADCDNMGISYMKTFDNMMLESINRGMHGTCRTESPAATVFMTTGKGPYIGFYYAVEGSNSQFFVDAALSMATKKLKSLFTGIFGQESKQSLPKIELPTMLNSRFQIRDFRRQGFRISTSPNRRLSAIADDFGRVVLVDNNDGLAVRIWKGYRDAECGWIEAIEERQQMEAELKPGQLPRPHRIALFLVIYCLRRGILEVWAMQQGPRVAAFCVGKNAKLLTTSHGILGLNNVTSVKDSRTQNRYCYLLDAEGFIKAVSIPFHYALTAKYSRRAKDLHLLNKVKLFLKDKSLSEEHLATEVSNAVLDIKMPSFRQEIIDLLIQQSMSTLVLKTVISRLVDYLQIQDPDSLDYECKMLLQSCLKQRQLLELYDGLCRLRELEPRTPGEDCDAEKPLQALSAMLHLPEPEIDHLLAYADRFSAECSVPRSVRFDDDQHMLSAGKFLSCFVTQTSHLPKESPAKGRTSSSETASTENTTDGIQPSISLVKGLTAEDLSGLGNFLYDAGIQNSFCLVELHGLLLQSGIDFQKLLFVLLEYWLQLEKGLSDWQQLRNFHNTVKFLSSLSALEEVVAGYNSLSPWWTELRKQLASSTNIAAAFTASLVCRGVAVTLASCQQAFTIETANEKFKDSPAEKLSTEECAAGASKLTPDEPLPDVNAGSSQDISLTDWENIDLDTEHWSLLVKQLEDLIVLNTLLQHRIPKSLLAEDHFMENEAPKVAVTSVLNGGRGAISILVSAWITRLSTDCLQRLLSNFGIKDEELADDGVSRITLLEEGREAINLGLENNFSEILGLLEEARKHFPNSLNRDVLFANCCWEFAVLWNKEKSSISNLQKCSLCLNNVIMASWGKGLATFLWHTFLKKPFIAIAQLIEKVHKVPKDRLCRKTVEMSDIDVEKYIGICVDLLDLLLGVGYIWDGKYVAPFQNEETWQIETGALALTNIVAKEQEPNFGLVCQSYKLALCLHMVLVYNLKQVKPLTLCDPRGMDTFLPSLTSKVTVSESVPDQTTIKDRIQFLCKVITAAVLTFPEPVFSDDPLLKEEYYVLTSKNSGSRQWIGQTIKLANLWSLNCDVLHRHYVCELYSSGLDSFGEEMLSVVSDREVLGSQLLLIAGQRIYNTITDSGDDYLEKLSMFPPMITTWFRTLNQNSLRCPNPPLSLTASMINYIMNMIGENQAEHKLAIFLSDPLQQLIRMETSQQNSNNPQMQSR